MGINRVFPKASAPLQRDRLVSQGLHRDICVGKKKLVPLPLAGNIGPSICFIWSKAGNWVSYSQSQAIPQELQEAVEM